MSTQLPPASSEPTPSEPTPTEPTPSEPASPGRLRGRVIAGVVAAVAFVAGIAIGAAASGEDEPDQPAAASTDDGDTAVLEEQVATLQGELDQVTTERDGLQATVTELEAAAAAATEAPPATAPPATTPPAAESPPAEPPAEEPPADETPPATDAPVAGGAYTAGQYEFADVQVSDDGIGGFALRARVTNTGAAVAGVLWTATLFLDGMVVATLDGSAQNLGAGATMTADFFSQDPFGEYDTVEFQIDGQY